ncbi:energy transducer TonB [Aliidiomarina minuta]|uniref:Protein TonB n=1 Tax=Aliidiomarina minuta TaxID=880057 RepID=A0A432W821_9GAMM|nr:energy transducer TonB [Aliidiomarina minuta]RUO26202.1 energy transducer TonB [Aliidiomarina minuta]
MVRLIVSILLGAAVTFALFVFMAFLISGGAQRAEPPEPPTRIDIVSAPPEQDVTQRQRTPPPPPEPPEQPPDQPDTEPDAADDAVSFGMDMGGVDLGGADTGLQGPGGAMGRDGDAQPIVRIEPRYPPAAARDGIEGWVRLRFTIDETGGVTDIEIIEAEPRRVFDQEARRALRRWRYAPQVVDGVPQRQEGMTVQLDFTMEGQ